MKRATVKSVSIPFRQRGIGLFEVMIAMTIGLFLIIGLLMVFQSMRITAQAQTGIARVQERQRSAVGILGNVIQSAGYFPVDVADPIVSADLTALKSSIFPSNDHYAEGAGISGTDNTVCIRFQAPAGDSVGKALNCHGGANQSGNKVLYDNLFYIQNNTLVCALGTDSKAVAGTSEEALVNSVKTLALDYGTDTDGNGSVTRYLKAASITDWHDVRSVRVQLVLDNPLADQAGQPDTVTTVHVIQLIGNT